MVQWVGPRWEFFCANVTAIESLLAYCSRHGSKGERWPSGSASSYDRSGVVRKFITAHDLADKYLKDFEKFKTSHAKRIAAKQAEEDGKTK